MRRRREQGVTLIENLIAMLILSVGLFGMLGVILNSLKLTFSSNYRSIAVAQAESMAEKLRGQPSLLAPSPAALITPGLRDSFSDPPTAVPVASNCRLGGISPGFPAQVLCDCFTPTGCPARADYLFTVFSSWQGQLAGLPRGRGTVCRDSTTLATLHQVDPDSDWRCDGAGGFVVKVCWNEQRIVGSAAPGAAATATSAEFKQASGWQCTFVGL